MPRRNDEILYTFLWLEFCSALVVRAIIVFYWRAWLGAVVSGARVHFEEGQTGLCVCAQSSMWPNSNAWERIFKSKWVYFIAAHFETPSDRDQPAETRERVSVIKFKCIQNASYQMIMRAHRRNINFNYFDR